MIYKGINLKVLIDTLSETTRKNQEIRHFPYSDKSVIINRGKEATLITATLKAESVSEKNTIKGLLNSETSGTLEIDDYFYKKVETGESGSFEPINPDKTQWTISSEFIALDPIPYDSETGDSLYG